MTPAELAELERLEKAATKGQLFFDGYSRLWVPGDEDNEEVLSVPVQAGDTATAQGARDARYLEALWNAAPALLETARRASVLEERNGKLEERVRRVNALLAANGCDCDCEHDTESHDDDCDRCLACRIDRALAPSTKGEG